MKVTLSADAERWVQERLDSGEYESSAEVVDEALRVLRGREEKNLETLRGLVREGLEDVEAGRTMPLDEAFAEAKRQALATIARG